MTFLLRVQFLTNRKRFSAKVKGRVGHFPGLSPRASEILSRVGRIFPMDQKARLNLPVSLQRHSIPPGFFSEDQVAKSRAESVRSTAGASSFALTQMAWRAGQNRQWP